METFFGMSLFSGAVGLHLFVAKPLQRVNPDGVLASNHENKMSAPCPKGADVPRATFFVRCA